MAEYEKDSDGLPISVVGEWALEKHERLRRYIEIARGARSKYVSPTAPGSYRGGASYIDLFSGPGRVRLRDTGEIVDGSPLVAFKAAASGMAPFSEVHLADIEPAFSTAAAQRIVNAGGNAFAYSGTAEHTAKQVMARLNPHGLHLALLDPYNLGDLSFAVVSTLARLKHVDFLMHVSVQDMQRNTDRYTAEDAKAFDRFAPGWRAKVAWSRTYLRYGPQC
jgi:three-Cys-motif partner protein